MKPAPFDWHRPADLTGALETLRAGGSTVIGGGQSLGPMLNLRLARPSALVEVRRLPELRASGVEAGALRLGAAVTHAEIEDGAVPDTTRGMLPYVARSIAYRAVRNRGTIGGSLCHADPAADWVNGLFALGASVHLRSAAGTRTLPVDAFVRGAYATALSPGEVLTSVELPAFGEAVRWGWYKICPKVGEFADAIGAVVVDPSIGHCRMLIGAIEARPVLVPEPHAVLAAAAAAAEPLEALRAVVELALPGRDPVFVHQHAVALARAIDAMNARRP